MAVNLQKGQKVDLTKGNAGLKKVTVGLGWDEAQKIVEEMREKIFSFTNSVSGYMIKVKSKAQKLESFTFETNKAALDLEQKKNRVHILEEMEKNIESCKKPIELEEEVIFYD